AKHVSHPAFGVDEPGGVGSGRSINLAVQVGDVRCHDRAVPTPVILPDVVEDLRLGKYPTGIEHEVAQQGELGGGELDELTPTANLVGVVIEAQVSHAQDGILAAAPARPAQHRADAGDDLVEAEGFGDVVVAAHREPGDLVGGVIARGEE